MENKIEKRTDSKFIGAGVLAILFTIHGIVELVNKTNAYWVGFGLSGLSLVYLFYLLNKTKDNKNERYDDERKEFISEKSSNMSFNILLGVIVLLNFMIQSNYIVVESSLLIRIMFWIVIPIKFGSYLICKYKY